jgi:hypothetical protein
MPQGKRKTFNIAGYDFDSATAVKKYLRSILNGHPSDTRLVEYDAVFRDLIAMHPRAAEKINGEISHFSIGPDGWGGRCFHVHRTDGTETDFSFYKCVDGEDRDDLVFKAMRTAVMDQIQQFRDAQLRVGSDVRCPFHTEIILDDRNSHVDHKPPRTFYVLVHQWLASLGMTIADVKISESKDNQTSREMTDPAQLNSWREFHRSNAQLRLTSKLGNLSDSKLEDEN